ncbi:hypothetical protein [Sphingomonas oryzagri]|uniref:Uncharacterized protein n=1 Tax=Sphingomonas oryzagri TaxID=3042314 RepID=A0ABT6MYU3_9SPHN|nr:hypothetical protein [Sphingomonas oryzagri]MDH7638234.1 hypothetical protein [Sphingomonas oryzagri]
MNPTIVATGFRSMPVAFDNMNSAEEQISQLLPPAFGMNRPITGIANIYRLYRMNALTEDNRSVENIEAFSDDEAIGRALDQAGDYRIELWDGERKLVAISGRNGLGELTICAPTDT